MSNIRVKRAALGVVVVVLIASACSGSHQSRSLTPTPTTAPVHNYNGVYTGPTGGTDVTADLQNFFTTKKSGPVALQPNAHFSISAPIQLIGDNGLTLDGQGATITLSDQHTCPVPEGQGSPPPHSDPEIRVKNSTGVTIENLNIVGADTTSNGVDGIYCPPLETQHGVEIDGTTGAKLDNVDVSDVWGDCFYIGQYVINQPSQNVLVENSDCSSNGRQGISVTAASNVVIYHNNIHDIRRSTIDLEPETTSATNPTASVDHVYIDDNTIGSGKLNFVAAHGTGPVNYVYIHKNYLYGHLLNIDELAGLAPRSNWVITGNAAGPTAQDSTITVDGVNGVYILDNRQDVNGGGSAALLRNDCVSMRERSDALGANTTTGCAGPPPIPQMTPIMNEAIPYDP
jgi:parallel beta-helix repeat protein